MSKVELQDLRLDNRYKKLKEVSKKEFPKIKDFIEKNKNGENSSGVDISEKTERKYIDSFYMAYKTLQKNLLDLNFYVGGNSLKRKSLDLIFYRDYREFQRIILLEKILDLEKKDLKKIKNDLKQGNIKSRFNRPYSYSSIREMQIILMRFLEYYNPEKYAPMKKWFVIKVPKKSIDYLKEIEIEKLYNACKTPSQRFLIAVLFDTGARASEFLNIRYEDIIEPTQSFPYYQVLFREEYSKTKERKIGLYWKKSTEAVREYLQEIGDKDSKEPIYNKSYDSIRVFLQRLGKKVLNKKVHFHTFRRSSASYYAMKLKSRQQLCYRYGWNFSSEVPDVYISRNQGEEEVKEDMLNTSMQKLKEENEELRSKVAINQKQIQEYEENKKNVKKEIQSFREFIKKHFPDDKLKKP